MWSGRGRCNFKAGNNFQTEHLYWHQGKVRATWRTHTNNWASVEGLSCAEVKFLQYQMDQITGVSGSFEICLFRSKRRRSCPKASGCQTNLTWSHSETPVQEHAQCVPAILVVQSRHASRGATSASRHSLCFWEQLWSLHGQVTSWHAEYAQVGNFTLSCSYNCSQPSKLEESHGNYLPWGLTEKTSVCSLPLKESILGRSSLSLPDPFLLRISFVGTMLGWGEKERSNDQVQTKSYHFTLLPTCS